MQGTNYEMVFALNLQLQTYLIGNTMDTISWETLQTKKIMENIENENISIK